MTNLPIDAEECEDNECTGCAWCDAHGITIPRVTPGDPHSAIDYAALGSELEHCSDAAELRAFATKFWQCTDAAMATLAVFALFKAQAVTQRLKGCIDLAMVAERNAETVYLDVAEGNRW